LDYSSTKGAIISFTRSLSAQLKNKKIRVNTVAPGPIWTPLVSSTSPGVDPTTFGQPAEVATCYVFLAAETGSLLTGQTIHPNGGEFITS
jgi:NAD(P)-dependent dehydrogenase (short-subunit alcohol dehydrogenase family)